MRFTNKRSSTSRRTPADAPSSVSETTDNALAATSKKARTSERVPATKPNQASETNLAPFAEPPGAKRESSSTLEPASSESSDMGRAERVAIPDELIAARAYEIWERRGCPMGHETEQDWHAARAELEQERLGWTQPRSDDRNKI